MAQPASSSGVTVLRAGIEDIEPNHWVVTVFDLLGCFSSGRTEEEAVAEAPRRAREYFAWLAQKDGNPAPFDDAVEIAVVERIRAQPAADRPKDVVHGLYEEDRRPLRLWDTDMIVRLLEWNRQDLLAVVHSAPADHLERPAGDPVWKTPGDLLAHIYGAEQWLLSHLDLSLARENLPRGRLERLEAIRRHTLEIVPGLAGDEQIKDAGGELWSPRKVMRRILWHERDHTRQLETLLRGMA
jgi:predicted RNase H-like HicB family nuclease